MPMCPRVPASRYPEGTLDPGGTPKGQIGWTVLQIRTAYKTWCSQPARANTGTTRADEEAGPALNSDTAHTRIQLMNMILHVHTQHDTVVF